MVAEPIPNPNPDIICSVIISYHPDDGFEQRLSLLQKQAAHVVIVDNASSPETRIRLGKLANEELNIIFNEENLGVAQGLNQGIHHAKKSGYPWVIMLDQDSIVGPDMVKTLADTFQSYPQKNKLAIVGANFIEDGSGLLKYKRPKSTSQKWIRHKTVITSGSLLSLEAYQAIGPFRSEFFIDSVDHDYCLKAASKGFHIISTAQDVMRHPIGKSRIHRLLGFKVAALHHSPARWFYITRNGVILVIEYLFKDPLWAVTKLIKLLGLIGTMLFCEEDRFKKMKLIGLGFRDAVFLNTKRRVL